MSRKTFNGPRQRRRRWRRRFKVLALCAVVFALAVVSSWTINAAPEPGKWDRPTRSELAVARNEYSLAGGPYGNAGILLNRYLQYGDYITGKVNDPRLCGPVWD